MRQVLHIFRKDCQQFWPEITATLAITACFVWLYPNQWTTWQDATVPRGNSLLDLHHMQILANTVTALVPVSWFFLIARIVHGENLIGNRQFWLTRPYRWQSLLAEKFLFILIFLYLPFLVGQVCLLGRAGFSPWTYLPGMLFNLLLLTGVMVLPLMGFAATVSTLLRMILILLGIVLLIVILAFFAGGFDENPSLQTPFSDRLSIPLILLFCGAALVIQYATRRAWLARGVLLGLVPLIALVAKLIHFP
jgi:hypothetical protein